MRERLHPVARIALSGGVLTQGAGVLCRVALTAGLARAMGASGLGAYTFCLALAQIVLLPARIGLPAVISFFIPKLEQEGKEAEAKGSLYLSVLATLLNFVFSALIISIVLAIWPNLISTITAGYLFAGLVVILLESLSMLLAIAMVSFAAAVEGLVLFSIVQPLLMIIALLTMAMSRPLSLDDVLAIQALSSCIILTVLAVLVRKKARARWGNIKARYLVRRRLQEFYPIMVTESVNEGTNNLVSIIVGSLLSLRELGHFRIIQTLSGAVLFLYTSLFPLIRPRVANLWYNGERIALAQLLRDSARAAFGLSVLPSILLLLFAPFILDRVFGPLFAEAYQPLLIIIAGSVLAAAAGYGMPLLSMTGYGKIAMRVSAGTGLFRIGLVVLLSSYLGLNGAALAVGLTLAGSGVLVGLIAFRLTGVDPSMIGIKARPSAGPDGLR